MSIEEARRAVQAAARGDWKMVEAVEAMARAVFRDELIKLSLAPGDEIARLSPAPVGGETAFERMTTEELLAGLDVALPGLAPTPPPAEPDGGEGTSAVAIRLSALPHEEIARLKRAVEAGGKRIAALEQRLAKATEHTALIEAQWTAKHERAVKAEATLAERDRRIAAASKLLEEIKEDPSHKPVSLAMEALGILTPATDKGGE